MPMMMCHKDLVTPWPLGGREKWRRPICQQCQEPVSVGAMLDLCPEFRLLAQVRGKLRRPQKRQKIIQHF